jgi:general secretion pathway protein B
MSFILDALKKSESDRQRQSGPSLFEVKVTPPRRALPVWAVAIAVLLAINVVVISWMLLRRGQAPRTAAPQTRAAAAPAAVAGAPAAASAPTQAGQPLSASGGVGTSAPARQAAASAPPASSAPTSSAAAAASAGPSAAAGTVGNTPELAAGPRDAPVDPSDYAPAVAPAGTQDAGGSPGTLPLYRQVVATDGLPQLHLDLHVYARNPTDRFVMINMHRLVEGASLPNGVHVDAIRPDGVVLSYHGTQFLLPRN